jgi:hypothetical protein|tara:strand:- start:213 stop:542 length:330 start_codon:yes stop_codon:yes gene_type:complete
MRKLVERIVLFVFGALCLTGVLFLSYSPEDPIDTVNKWFKVATDEAISGEVVILDMSRGYSYSQAEHIILVVKDSEGYDTVIAFPNGGYWTAPVLNPELNKKVEWKKEY